MTERRPFCPTCLAGPLVWTRRPRVRRGITRVLQDVMPPRSEWGRRRFTETGSDGRRSIRVRRRIHHSGRTSPDSRVMGRTWTSCPDPWHNPPAVTAERRPAVDRPKADEVRARAKAKARRHKARQINR